MLSIKEMIHRSPEEKEKIILEVQRLGVASGCRKHGIDRSQYYNWLRKYQAQGLEGLKDRRKNRQSEAAVKRMEKEIALLKEMIVERDLELKLKGDLLKKKIAQWNREKK